MSFAKRFEDLKIWRSSRELVNNVYAETSKCRDFEFRDQIRSAALSVMNNIAEGFERRTKKDFAHFLDQAKGSAAEVRSMTYLGEDQDYLSIKSPEIMRQRYENLAQSIGALASRLRSHTKKQTRDS